MAHEFFVNTPTWFNEGMAEYFETMTVNNSVVTITPQKYWHQILRRPSNINNISLERLVTMTPGDFYQGDNSLNYAAAWSLITFLMQTEKGKDFLRKYAGHMYDFYCFNTPTMYLIDKYYPGGAGSLEEEWRSWISNKAIKSHIWRF